MAIQKVIVGKSSDFDEGRRVSIEVAGREVVVFKQNGNFYALLNRCPHRGADLCTAGRLLPLITSDRPGNIELHDDRVLLACPWHGWEFDIATGQSYFDPNGTSVRPFEVELQSGSTVATDLETGEAAITPAQYTSVRAANGAVEGRQPGPYRLETFEVEVENEYIVVFTRPSRPRVRGAVNLARKDS